MERDCHCGDRVIRAEASSDGARKGFWEIDPKYHLANVKN